MTQAPRIRGVLSPVVTPFGKDLSPDPERLIAHCKWLLTQNCGLAVFGTNSEANSLSANERIALFGTHNLDVRSLWLNFEVSLCVYDEAFGAQLHSLQQSYLQNCVAIDPQSWRERPFARRAMENAVRLFSPLL